MQKNMESPFDYKVFKSNQLIESKPQTVFSAVQHRIIATALAQIKPTDSKLAIYFFDMKDILGDNNFHYQDVKKAVVGLHKTVIEIKDDTGEWTTYSFVVTSQGKKGSSRIGIQFHESIQKFLIGLKGNYTSYMLKNVVKFRKNYSLRIYELCKQYQKIGYRIIEVFYLRELLLLNLKYKDFAQLRKYVLKPSIIEINEYSDIYVTCEEMKTGRKISHLKFIIHKNEKAPETIALPLTATEEQLQMLGFTSSKSTEITELYSEEYLAEKIALLDSQISGVKNPVKWLEKAIEENWHDSRSYLTFKEEEKEQEQEKEQRQKKHQKLEKALIKEQNEIVELKEVIKKVQINGQNEWMRKMTRQSDQEFIADTQKSLKESKAKIKSLQDELNTFTAETR